MATHQKKHTQNKGIRELIFKDKSQEYAVILASIGDYRFDCQLLNGEKFKAKLVGGLISGPNRTRICKGDNVLVGRDINNTEKDKWYIQHKYSSDDWKNLGKQGELTVIRVNNATEVSGTTILMDGDIEQENKVVEIDDNFVDNI
jgi:translation initiation factor IF-1